MRLDEVTAALSCETFSPVDHVVDIEAVATSDGILDHGHGGHPANSLEDHQER